MKNNVQLRLLCCLRFISKQTSTQENTMREHEDEIDHLKQKSLRGKVIITSKTQYGECFIKSDEQLKEENKSLAKHVIDLVKLKYKQDITEESIQSCFRLNTLTNWYLKVPCARKNISTTKAWICMKFET